MLALDLNFYDEQEKHFPFLFQSNGNLIMGFMICKLLQFEPIINKIPTFFLLLLRLLHRASHSSQQTKANLLSSHFCKYPNCLKFALFPSYSNIISNTQWVI